MYQVILSDEARQDEIEGYDYYESGTQGLGEAFLAVLEDCYFRLSKHPQAYSFTDNRNTLRDMKVTRFPYLIIFEISGNSVYVYSVHNTYKFPFNNDG